MNGGIRRWWFWCIAALVVLADGVRGEVHPTGRKQPLFSEPSHRTPTDWQVRCLPTGQQFLLAVYYASFKATIETSSGPLPFSQLPWAKEAIIRIRVDEL